MSERCFRWKGKRGVCSAFTVYLFRSYGLMLRLCFDVRISGRCFRWKGKRGVCSVLYICSARAVLCCAVVFMQGYPDAASAGRASAESALYCISVPLVRSYAVGCIWALPLLKRQAQSLLCTVQLLRSYAVASRAARFMLVVPAMRGTCAM